MNEDPEFCICAAILLKDGQIIRGHRHDDCIHTASKLSKAGQKIKFPIRQDQQGFVTSRNRFVGREEGAALMRSVHWRSAWTGQQFESDLLFSEDLY